MKTFFRPSNILFYFLSAVMFFFLGMFFAGIINAAENQGLAAGAIVFGYGVGFAFTALICSIVAAKFLSENRIVLINKIFAAILVLLLVFIVYRILTIKSAAETSLKLEPATRINYILTSGNSVIHSTNTEYESGLGMAKPNFYENRVLYFFSYPNFDKTISDLIPIDSLVFTQTEIGFEITYAPPWFVPANLKLDYEILFLHIVSLHRDFVEVIVNETDGRTAYVDRSKCEIIFWPEFLLNVFSVELIEPESNPVRVKPLGHASLVTSQFRFLKPIQINSQWLQVELLDDAYCLLDVGWIKWHENGKLLITYSLLS